ncbi:membrane fusion protein, cobalt-zinc-cadmium efflux system [Lutibacter agarilyticus]|uniref:Membrane fusion protein, cobalt-zinc-cadmium efflux system n=1 Tax=Lutibacter agarilyticus TaxID=1109740 RepID=A0A238VCZ4_9FLAO|nr:efflux RND transporter periplasmic adaptor subunit [Lutibacter agarilyticus]SNR31917.1 membrane fusion protein, cobalt-zinc-cadmium efflux system [Lutibacter agarilyticus]
MKKYILKSVCIVSAMLIISCTSTKKSDETIETVTHDNDNLVEITVEQFQNSKMKIGKLSMETFNKGVVTNGHIDVPPANRAQVSAIMGGYVKTSPLLVGNWVEKGQRLLTLENPDYIEIQQKYLETFEQLNYLKSEYERQKTLFDEKITSQKNYLKAESTYKSTIALFNGLEQKLLLMNINPSNVKEGKITSIIPIYAPISGSVAEVYTSVGKFMDASEVLISIIDSKHKHLELIVFEKDVMSIKEGQLIEFQTPENSERIYKAEVHLIGTSIDQENRTVRVHGHLEDKKEPFLVGMYVEAKIITYTAEKLALPLEAVLEEDDKYYILILNEHTNHGYTFEKEMVHIGLKNETSIEIIDINNTLKDKQILVEGAFIPLDEEAGGHSH